MAIGKETSNPLFSMIHLSQELTHLEVMRIVLNLCFDVHLVICCCKEWCFEVFADHRDAADEASLLLKFMINPLLLELKIYQESWS